MSDCSTVQRFNGKFFKGYCTNIVLYRCYTVPKKGYKVITIRQTVYDLLNKEAERQDRSIASLVKEVVENYFKEGSP